MSRRTTLPSLLFRLTAGAVEEGLDLGGHHAEAGGDAEQVAVQGLELVQLVKGQHGVVGLGRRVHLGQHLGRQRLRHLVDLGGGGEGCEMVGVGQEWRVGAYDGGAAGSLNALGDGLGHFADVAVPRGEKK